MNSSCGLSTPRSAYRPTEMSGLDDEGARACVDYSLIELARTGTTTVLQMGGVEEYAADAIEASGLRGYVAPMYRSR